MTDYLWLRSLAIVMVVWLMMDYYHRRLSAQQREMEGRLNVKFRYIDMSLKSLRARIAKMQGQEVPDEQLFEEAELDEREDKKG